MVAPNTRWLCGLGLVLAALWLAPPARAGEDPLARVQTLLDAGTRLVEIGSEKEDAERIREGVRKFREAHRRLQHVLADAGLSEASARRARAYLVDVDSRIEWYGGDASGTAEFPSGEVRVPEAKRGESKAAWCRRIRKLYDEAGSPHDKAALARGLAAHGGAAASKTLFQLFEDESAAEARVGIHEALAMLGGERVATRMATYARKRLAERWADALEVTYLALALAKNEKAEKPYLAVIRSFHKLKDEALSRGMLERLDKLEPAGTRALGEVLYLPDFGHHKKAIERLSRKQDTRAAAALAHAAAAATFDPSAPRAVHKALLTLRWYAVPELMARLATKSPAPWVFWTLEKIGRAGLGPDRAAWRAWWKQEGPRHPEVLPPPKNAPKAGDGDTGSK